MRGSSVEGGKQVIGHVLLHNVSGHSFSPQFCDTVQHIQSSSSEGPEEVNSALAEPEDLDEDEPIQVDGQQAVGLLKQVEAVQQRATKYILRLPFRCDVPYKTRLLMTNLIPLSFLHKYLDIFFYKAVNNLIYVNSDALPVARQPVRITRYSSNSSVTYIPKKCRTLSYQRSFFVRCARIWNVLPESLKEHNQTSLAFKRSLLKYYTNAVDIFDQEDIRTWRTICPKCNTAKTLTRPPHCCFKAPFTKL